MPRLTSIAFDGSASSALPSTNSSKPSLGLTDALHILKLDAYEIKPSEIEIMKNLDGSPAVLGKGAFGEVGVTLWCIWCSSNRTSSWEQGPIVHASACPTKRLAL